MEPFICITQHLSILKKTSFWLFKRPLKRRNCFSHCNKVFLLFKLHKWQILSNSLERYFSIIFSYTNFGHKVEVLDHLFSEIQRSTDCKSYKESDRNSESTWSIHKGEESINDARFHFCTYCKWSNRHYVRMADQNLAVDKPSGFLI